MNVYILTATILTLARIEAGSCEMFIPLFNRRPFSLINRAPLTNVALLHQTSVLQKKCYSNNEWTECPVLTSDNLMTRSKPLKTAQVQSGIIANAAFERSGQVSPYNDLFSLRRMIDQNNNLNMIRLLHGKLDRYQSQSTELPILASNKLNMKLDSIPTKSNKIQESFEDIFSSHNSDENAKVVEVTTELSDFPISASEKFMQSLDNFERKFYATTFSKLAAISPPERRENGMSYVQSGLFLQLALMALSAEVGPETRREIDDCLGLHISDQEKVELINTTISSLPPSSDDLKFRWSSRLVLNSQQISEQYRAYSASVLRLQIDNFNGTETPKEMAQALNHMVEIDSGGAIHNTFEEDELTPDVRAVLLNTLYLRARWRSAPTLLNGTRPFRDVEGTPNRSARMIRVNDIMRYADLTLWDAEALEIPYSTPGLSLLMLVPRSRSLSRLVDAAVNTSLSNITALMRPLRIAATLPLYTLRMTLLLPNKLQAMNISRLVEGNNGSETEFRLSLAVQRTMFWAEAGRNAFKDDGLEWDETPQKNIIVDRPYIFYVRWKNNTLMNGNFVL